jgi:uncharacterized protein with HEPN domain
MDTEIKVWLYDVLNAINEIESFFTNAPVIKLNAAGDNTCSGK